MKVPIQINIEIDDWSEDNFSERVVAKIVQNIQSDVQKQVHDRARKVIDDTLKERAQTIIDEYLSKPIPTTNQYGEYKGKTQTLTEMFVETSSKYLQEKVNKNGNSPGYNDPSMPRLDWIIRNVCLQDLEAVVKAAVAEARKKGEAVMQAAIAELMAKHLPKGGA